MSTSSREGSICDVLEATPPIEDGLAPPQPTLLNIPSASSSTSSLVSKDNINKENKEKEKVIIDKELLPHPAEDLSSDDDLLSWILVDQLGCMPNTKLGVHPQQVKFVGPTFKTDEVLNIVRETVTKGNLQGAMQRLQEFHLIKSHLQSKMTDYQRERFTSHLRRYLLPLLPNSRLEIHLTSRYSHMTGHTELAIFATRPLTPGLVMQELQGSVVPLPDQWREEMEIGEDFAVAVEAPGEETDSDGSDQEDNDDLCSLHSAATNARRDKGKGKEVDNNTTRKGQRRSDRTKRRDFSIVWSGLKRCYQLFLGPARFLNHDCNPNVELLRQGKFVTFRVLKPIRVGDELTTFYGENYFGRNNIECLCLTCEQKSMGGFTPDSTANSGRESRSKSIDSAAGSSRRGTSTDMRESVAREIKNVGPSSLRNVVKGLKDDISDDDSQSIITGGPSQIDGEDSSLNVPTNGDVDTESTNATPTKKKPLKLGMPPSPTSESIASESDSPIDPPPRRERIIRKVVQNIKPWSFLQRPKKVKKGEQASEIDEESTDVIDDLPSNFPRCGSCAKPLHEQIWFNGRYFEHCARCVRHAFIFELPWPAHKSQDVREYPPTHLIPSGYIPRKISTIPLPSLSKQPKFVKAIEISMSPGNETKAMARARRLRDQIAAEEFFIESLREAAWSAQEAREAAIEAKEAALVAQKLAREEEKKKRAEEKKQRDAKNIKGSGVWSRYAYVSEEEMLKKELERNQVLSGTRRGGRFRSKEDEEEMKKLAEIKLKEEENERLLALGIEPTSFSDEEDDDDDDEDDEDDEDEIQEIERISNNSIVSTTSSGTSAEIVVDPDSLYDSKQKVLYKYKFAPSFSSPSASTSTSTSKMKIKNNGKISNQIEIDKEDEMEVSIAPELSIVESNKYIPPSSKSTLPSQNGIERSKSKSKPLEKSKTATIEKTLPIKSQSSTALSSYLNTTPFRAIAPKKPTSIPNRTSTHMIQKRTSEISSSTVNTPRSIFGNPPDIIDLTLSSDDESSSTTSGPTKKKQGRPLGSGKHQKAAVRKLAKAKSASNGNSPSGSKSSSTNKGKEKAQANNSPKTSKNHVITSGIEFIDSPISSSSKPSAIRSAATLGDTAAAIAKEIHAGPSKIPSSISTPSSLKKTTYPVLGGILLPPSGSGSGSGSSSSNKTSGSGGSGTSSVDMTEITLDQFENTKTPHVKNKGLGSNQTSPNQISPERKAPRLILNVTKAKEIVSAIVTPKNNKIDQNKTNIFASANTNNSNKGKEKEQPKPLFSNGQLNSPINGNGTQDKGKGKGLSNGNGHINGNATTAGAGDVQDPKIGEKIKQPTSTSSSTVNGHVKVDDKKRKRISETSETSSSSSPSNPHQEKKKRTFFPPVISVSVLKPTPVIPKPKHSIHK